MEAGVTARPATRQRTAVLISSRRANEGASDYRLSRMF